MKRLEELGISPAPWEVVDADSVCADVCSAEITEEVVSPVAESVELADAHLIAAAPKMYDVCFRALRWEDYSKAHGRAFEPWKDIMHDMRAVLAEAAGEGEVAK